MLHYLQNISLKKLTIAMACGFICAVLLSFAGFDAKCCELRENVLRLHILANSDAEADQALKLAVRDRLLQETGNLFQAATDKQSALEAATKQLPFLQKTAEDQLRQLGCNYPVRVEVGKSSFNTREYENFTLPAGEYDAVRVLIGNAAGKNWWCVLFPALCIPAAENPHQLSEAVTPDAAKIAENPKHYKVAFKSVEIYEQVSEKLKSLFTNN